MNGLRMQVNEDRLRHPGRNIFVADLVDHYEQTELSEKTGRHSHATRIVYHEYLTRWIRPHWGNVNACSVRTIAVEHWLRQLRRADGIPLANTTKAKAHVGKINIAPFEGKQFATTESASARHQGKYPFWPDAQETDVREPLLACSLQIDVL